MARMRLFITNSKCFKNQKRLNLNFAQRQSSAIRLAADKSHLRFNNTSLKSLTWIHARVLTQRLLLPLTQTGLEMLSNHWVIH